MTSTLTSSALGRRRCKQNDVKSRKKSSKDCSRRHGARMQLQCDVLLNFFPLVAFRQEVTGVGASGRRRKMCLWLR